jgi:hypothetical protein
MRRSFAGPADAAKASTTAHGIRAHRQAAALAATSAIGPTCPRQDVRAAKAPISSAHLGPSSRCAEVSTDVHHDQFATRVASRTAPPARDGRLEEGRVRSRSARFALDGKHAPLACGQCHFTRQRSGNAGRRRNDRRLRPLPADRHQLVRRVSRRSAPGPAGARLRALPFDEWLEEDRHRQLRSQPHSLPAERPTRPGRVRAMPQVGQRRREARRGRHLGRRDALPADRSRRLHRLPHRPAP